MDRRKIDVGLSTFLIIIAVIILTNDNLAEGGAESDLGIMFLPRAVAGLMILFAGTIAIQAFQKLAQGKPQEENEIISTDGFGGIAIYIGIFVLYWLAVPYIGFMVTTPFIMLAVAYLLGGRNWLPITVVSVVVPILIYYGSREFLRVYLPTWSL
ncbi:MULTISPECIES: tripartite tricarboxylate transporter TctB family protein [Neptunomonas]|uniref:Tripartite tricarboxylate transporter TctB family protein n=1 Tax=Neptunomonas marina TaxID=1815562 RepID=A0A437Q4L0_9GAMM|nr:MULTISPECIES: tripartite tricarboxylate transporter TctB family protein [Neptunomonas]RVU29458.1 tripartite tricarboxylate transporter TctB family protein [Neptunomonas marina]